MQSTTKVAALKELQSAASRKNVQQILSKMDQPPSGLLAQEINEEKRKKGTRIFLAVMATLFIVAITTFAYIGGGYISEYAGPVALIFGALDLCIVFILFADGVKGKLRLFLVLFEIGSLAYLGYATSGYFGGGNLRTAAEKMLAADYAVAKEHYTSTQTTADLLDRAIKNASSVRDVEAARDGKGVVFEKASFIASMKADSVRPAVFPSNIPSFKDLLTGNKWLQAERQKVAEYVAKYDAAAEAMRNQAKGTEQSLRDAMKMGLSQQQLSNLQVLAASMQEIAAKEPATSKLSQEILKPADLKADGFQNIIGYLMDVAIIFCILVLALQKSSEKRIDEIKDQETKAIMDHILSDDGISYDAEMVKDVPGSRQYEAFKVLYGSEELFKYVKAKVSFDQYVRFFVDHPVLARKLGATTWSLADIRKELSKNASFANIAEEVIQITAADWKLLNEVTNNPEDLFQMEEGSRAKFLKVLKQINAKKRFRSGELKTFMSQFLLEENPSENFMVNLDKCAETLNADRLEFIHARFINATDPVVMKYLCETVTTPGQFKKVVSGWNDSLDKSLSSILNDGIVADENFDRLMKVVLDQGGIDGFKKFSRAYSEKKSEANSLSIGNKVLELNPDYTKIKTALTAGNDTEFLKEIGSAIVIKNSATEI